MRRLRRVDDVLLSQPLYGANYDDDDNQLTERRLGQGQLGWKYDAFGRLVEEDRTLNGATAASKYEYDGNDRVTRYTDAVTSSWSMTFTGWDAPLTVTDPLGRGGTYTYETSGAWPHGLVASMTEPNGRVTSFAYDSEARLTDIYDAACPSGRAPWECGVLQPRRHMTYDERGHVKQVDVPDRESMPHVPSVFFTYDSLDRLAQEQVGDYATVLHPLTDAGRTETSQVSYIPPGQAEVVATVTRHYDNTDRLHTVELNGNTLATYDFGTGIGGPRWVTYANGAKATFDYDNMLRQTKIDVTFLPSNTVVASLHEAFGSDSIPRMRQRKIGSGPTWTDVFQVDEDGRLSKEDLRLNNVTMPSGEIENGDVDTYMSGPRLRTYELDNIGNIKKVTTNNSVLLHQVDALSRLTKLGDDTVNHDGTDNLTGTSAPKDKVTLVERVVFVRGRARGARGLRQRPGELVELDENAVCSWPCVDIPSLSELLRGLGIRQDDIDAASTVLPLLSIDALGARLAVGLTAEDFGVEAAARAALPSSEPIARSVGAMSRAEALARKLRLNISSPTTRLVLNSLDLTVADPLG